MSLAVAKHAIANALACGLMIVTVGCGGVDNDFIELTHQSSPLSSTLGTPAFFGTTCGLYNSVTPTCTTSNASDKTYGWFAPSTGSFTFSTTGSSFDTVMVIADYNNPSSVLACAGSVSGTGGESVSLSLSSGQQLLVTVDGYASLCGDYKLNITQRCEFNCQWYEDGQHVSSGVRCSSKVDGYCIGGVFAGEECVASGTCYATCNNGTWE